MVTGPSGPSRQSHWAPKFLQTITKSVGGRPIKSIYLFTFEYICIKIYLMFNESKSPFSCIATPMGSFVNGLYWILPYSFICHEFIYTIRSSDNDSTSFWPPGSLHTLGADGHILQRDGLFMWIKILSIEYILWGMPTIESIFDVANMVKTVTVKDVAINNDALLNIQAY